ncbi:unnamed protein product [Calypogeia fissa]
MLPMVVMILAFLFESSGMLTLAMPDKRSGKEFTAGKPAKIQKAGGNPPPTPQDAAGMFVIDATCKDETIPSVRIPEGNVDEGLRQICQCDLPVPKPFETSGLHQLGTSVGSPTEVGTMFHGAIPADGA